MRWIQIIVSRTSYQLRYAQFTAWYRHCNFGWWILNLVLWGLCPNHPPMGACTFGSKAGLSVSTTKCCSIRLCPYSSASTQYYPQIKCALVVFLEVYGKFRGWTVPIEWIPASCVRSTTPFRPYASCSWSPSFASLYCRFWSRPFLAQIIWDYMRETLSSISSQLHHNYIIIIAKWA